MHEVHRPGLVWLCSVAPTLTQLRFDSPLRRFIAEFQA
jgi:hypothetical protein